MKRFIFGLLAFVLISSQVSAGSIPLLGAGKSGGGSAYTGPLDLVAGAKAAYGIRALSSAYRGSKLVSACNIVSGSVVGSCVDLLSDATTGLLVGATVGGVTCPGTATCQIVKWYDQTGGNNCTGSCDLNAAGGNVYQGLYLTANCVGTLPCARGDNGVVQNTVMYAAGNWSLAQPITISASMFVFTGSTGESIAGDATFAFQFLGLFGGTATFDAGTTIHVTSAANAFHNFQIVFNGGSSSMMVDATANTSLNPGSNGMATIAVNGEVSVSSALGLYEYFEVIVWNSALSGANQTALCHNQYTYWFLPSSSGTSC